MKTSGVPKSYEHMSLLGKVNLSTRIDLNGDNKIDESRWGDTPSSYNPALF